MTAAGIDLDAMDALSLAEQAGSAKAVNLVLMGRLSRYFDIPQEEWLAAIEQSVPPKFLEMNKKAFALGANA
jgi:indolepyruvate ferredoxin oxidoreductase beta subunit